MKHRLYLYGSVSPRARRSVPLYRACRGLLSFIPPVSLFLSLLLSEPPPMLLMALSAVCLHEGGHILVFSFLMHETPVLSLDVLGMRLLSQRPMHRREEALVALGGPLANLLVGLLFLRLGTPFFLSFGITQLLFGFFNLLPMASSDGERLLSLLLYARLSVRHAEGILLFVSVFTLAFLALLSLYSFYFTGNGLAGVFFSVFSFPVRRFEQANDF